MPADPHAGTFDRPHGRIIAALDVPSAEQALALARRLAGHVGLVKVGLELFVAEGPSVVAALRQRHPDLGIFLDLKLHDIPNTMGAAVRAARRLGAAFLTVHAAAGVAHLRACVEAADGALGILAVTVLTSQDARALAEAGATRTVEELVAMRAECAARAGCAGIVCSGRELAAVRRAAPGLATVVPGIRPAGAGADDQVRVMTPGRAVRAGADYLVVGRPIRTAPDPAAAADAIAAEVAAAAP